MAGCSSGLAVVAAWVVHMPCDNFGLVLRTPNFNGSIAKCRDGNWPDVVALALQHPHQYNDRLHIVDAAGFGPDLIPSSSALVLSITPGRSTRR
jgi:hypothetical protein